MSQQGFDIRGWYTLRPDFLAVIQSVPGVDSEQTVFHYPLIAKLLSTYILSKKNDFFDARNISIAQVKGDPLEKAFDVGAFHRSQVTGLMRKQLIPAEAPIDDSDTGEGEENGEGYASEFWSKIEE